MWETWVLSLGWEDSLEKGQATHSSILQHGSDSKKSTWNVGDVDWDDPMEKGKATHSSILAWRIPWTVESMGSQRVGRDSDFHFPAQRDIKTCVF